METKAEQGKGEAAIANGFSPGLAGSVKILDLAANGREILDLAATCGETFLANTR